MVIVAGGGGVEGGYICHFYEHPSEDTPAYTVGLKSVVRWRLPSPVSFSLHSYGFQLVAFFTSTSSRRAVQMDYNPPTSLARSSQNTSFSKEPAASILSKRIHRGFCSCEKNGKPSFMWKLRLWYCIWSQKFFFPKCRCIDSVGVELGRKYIWPHLQWFVIAYLRMVLRTFLRKVVTHPPPLLLNSANAVRLK